MPKVQREQFLDRVERLLASQRVGVLATNYRKTPHLSLIAYVSSQDMREIFFVTPRYTRKVAAIESDHHVSLLVDDRQVVERDFSACAAVTAKGEAEAIAGQPRQVFLPRYLERHPYLEEFVASPSCACYRIRVRSYTLVSSFQRVEELLL